MLEELTNSLTTITINMNRGVGLQSTIHLKMQSVSRKLIEKIYSRYEINYYICYEII